MLAQIRQRFEPVSTSMALVKQKVSLKDLICASPRDRDSTAQKEKAGTVRKKKSRSNLKKT